MTFDSRWKNPQGSDPKQLHLWAQDLIKELRRGDYQSSITDAVSALSAAAFQSFALQVFTADDTYTPTDNMLFCLVISTGGGGGGGGADGTDATMEAAAAGGSSGATCIELFTAAQIGASQAVTVGVGGTAGSDAGGNGGNGEDTTFGALHTAGGGPGGQGISTGGTGIGAPAAGGVATGGHINIPGGYGGPGDVNVTDNIQIGGYGAASFWGGGPASAPSVNATGSTAGADGTAPGTGGSGAECRNSTTGSAGGAGANGICVVLELIGGAA